MKSTFKKADPKRPTHRVYAVSKNGDRSYWRSIGAAWSHSDGEGLSVRLEYLPLNGAEIVIRTPREDDAEPDAKAGTELSPE